MNAIKESDIAIIGMSGRFPGANSLEEFWQNLRDGVESISRFSEAELLAAGVSPAVLADENYVRAGTILDNADRFDAAFFGFSPKEASILDPQHRLFLECAWEVLEQTGYTDGHRDAPIGLYAGAGTSQYLLQHLYRNPVLGESVSDYQLMLATEQDFLPTRAAYKLNLTGPAVNVQTACSTSLVAVHLACQALLNGECDLALAGGVSLKLPQTSGYLYQTGMIRSPDGHCRAFDAEARGTLGGSGVGVVLLKPAADAIAARDRIHALIKGSAINNDGNQKVGFTAPSIAGQSRAIAEAQAIAEVSADSIAYVEAHGTGTELGDPIEIAALTRAFRQTTPRKQYCAIASLKSNIGHLDTAAGIAGLIKATLALQHGQIPPSLHCPTPNPKIDWEGSPFFVNTVLRDWPEGTTPRRAGVSSFGIGGTNAHVILEEAPSLPPLPLASPRPQLLVLSAKTPSALTQMSANLAAHWQQHPHLALADIAYTLSQGRRTFSHRQMWVAATREEALSALESPLEWVKPAEADPTIIFLFPGQGSQYINMGRELYEEEAVFGDAIARCAEILAPELGLDLRALIYPAPEDIDKATQQLMQTAIAQPAIFSVEYALMQLWESWGISPQSAIGHSIGEYVAACRAGVFALEDVLHLLALRGRLIQDLPPGSMLSVPQSGVELQPLLAKDCAIAAENESQRCVVSGPPEAIATLARELSDRGIESRPLHTSHAFHSPMMEPILAAYARVAAAVPLNPPQMPFISSVTGTWITPEQATDPHYWSQHLRSPVRFAAGLAELWKAEKPILLEVGPGRTLSTFARRHPLASDGGMVATSLRHPLETRSDRAVMLQALGQLWQRGASVDWSGVYAGANCDRVPLPTYPFERQQFWIDPPQFPKRENPPVPSPPNRSGDPADWFYLPSWQRIALPVLPPASPKQESWLIFLDRCGLGATLAEKLGAAGERVYTVEAGDRFARLSPDTYCLSPGELAGYRSLRQALEKEGNLPARIVHLWSVSPTPPRGTLAERLKDLEAWQDLSFYSLVFLARVWREGSRSCQLTAIANGMQEVWGGELNTPEKALLLGAVRVIPLEYPHMACRSIDIDFPNKGDAIAPRGLIDQLLVELHAPIDEPAIAYRGDYRWVQRFESIALPHPTPEGSRLKPEGVYLLTGGLGGIGLEIAGYLAETTAAKLVFVGRSPFPPRENWPQWLAEHPPEDSISLKIRRLSHLESLGSRVLVCQADVSDAAATAEAIAKVRQQFGAIDGVIHAAGIPDGGLIHQTTKEESNRQMAAKVRGTIVLDALLQDSPPDFWVLFSSLNAVKPVTGQVGYCASNAFLDAFAPSRRGEAFPSIVAIDWYGWRDTGMAAVARKARPDYLSPQEGIEAFARILSQPLTRVLVSTIPLTEFPPKVARDDDSPSPSPQPPKTRRHLRPNSSVPYVPPRNAAEATAIAVWEEILGIESIGVHDNFLDLGGDSLMATQAIARLRRVLHPHLSVASLFEAPTVAELVASLSPSSLPESPTSEREEIEL